MTAALHFTAAFSLAAVVVWFAIAAVIDRTDLWIAMGVAAGLATLAFRRAVRRAAKRAWGG